MAKTEMDVSNVEETAFERTIDHFISQESELMRSLNDDTKDQKIIRKEIERIALEQFMFRVKDSTKVQQLLERFKLYMWGYYILEPLIRDPDIQDITIYSYDRVRAERNGTWEDGKVQFLNKADYDRFIRTVCTRNQANLSRINALPKFTDAINDKDYILRFNVTSGFLVANGETEMHIRKIPKHKLLMDDLREKGYMTKAQQEYITKAIKSGKNIIFSGSNGSGKTFGLNAAIEEIPYGKSGIIMQESDELFTNNPDFLATHVSSSSGEAKISYGLKELCNRALMDAREVFVLGEVKSGNDAAEIPTITTTGAQVFLTSHGSSSSDAIYKIADYVMQETGYEFTQCLRFLTNFLVIFVKKFKITEMSMIKNWDYEKNDLVIESVDINGHLSVTSEKELIDYETINLNNYIFT